MLCAALATIGTIMIVRKMVFMSGTTFRQFLELRFRPSALRHTERLEDLLAKYQEISDILGQYTPDYSIVFNEANWTKLNLSLEELNAAYGELCEMLERGESKDALCLAEFLTSAGEPLAEWKYKHISDEWEGLADWQHDLHDIVCQVIQSLRDAVIQARKLGISRGKYANETLAALDQISARM